MERGIYILQFLLSLQQECRIICQWKLILERKGYLLCTHSCRVVSCIKRDVRYQSSHSTLKRKECSSFFIWFQKRKARSSQVPFIKWSMSNPNSAEMVWKLLPACSLETLILIIQNKNLFLWAISHFIMHWEEFFEAVH